MLEVCWKDLKALLLSRTVWLATVIFVALVILAHTIPFNAMSATARGWQLWVSLVAIIAYWALGYRAVKKRVMETREDRIAVGICGLFLFGGLTAAAIVYTRVRYPGQPVTSDWINIFVAMQYVCGLLFVTPGLLENRTPAEKVVISGGTVAALIVLVWMLIAGRPF